MKPTNTESGCDPTSSDCVIWQGDDIECINLCKGDSVSVVVSALATELCTLLNTFSVDNYDISCLNLAECTPEDFAALIQLLIDKVCEENGIVAGETAAAGCPDCEVTVCPEFYYQNPQGDTETTMQLADYVLAIGNRVCALVGQIGTINATLIQHATRITTLENAPVPTVNLPTVVPFGCVLPASAVDIDTLLEALEEQFCLQQTATGDSSAIISAMLAACSIGGANQLTNPLLQMNALGGWTANAGDMAQSFANLWLTVCDMRSAVADMQLNCCDSGCSSIVLQVVATVNNPGELQLDFAGTIPSIYIDDTPNTQLVITDSNNGSQTLLAPIKQDYFDLTTPWIIPLTVDGTLDLNITLTYKFVENNITASTCQGVINTIALGTETCPNLVIAPGYTDVNYNFDWLGTNQIIVAELYINGVFSQSQNLNVITGNPSGSFTGLEEGTIYEIGLIIGNSACPLEDFQTSEWPCVAPITGGATFDYTDPEGDPTLLVNPGQTGSTIVVWQTAYDLATHPTPTP